MPQRNNTRESLNEDQIQLAIKAIQQDATLTHRRAAAIYNVSKSTLSSRLAGTRPRRDCKPKSMKLLLTEEETTIQHVLDLVVRGFPPRLDAVRDMADSLLAERHRYPVGENWAKAFVKRRPELKVKFNRKYDFKRAPCEDPIIIRGWFELVESTKAEYGIVDEDTYNFDETGFMMG